MLTLEDVVVDFDGFTVLDNLSLDLEEGELRFLIGPNGAGKTTLLDLITGKVKPSAGKVAYGNGVDISKHAEHTLVRMGIGRKFQTPSIYRSLSVWEHLEVAIGFRRSALRWFGGISWVERERMVDALTTVSLQDRADVKAGALSHGEKQWLEIAMLLVQGPQLLLLDEPVAGMTRQEREKTGELIHNLEGRHTILITEHDMDFVRRFSRTVTVMHLGKVLTEGLMEDVQRDPRVIEVYLGRSHAEVSSDN